MLQTYYTSPLGIIKIVSDGDFINSLLFVNEIEEVQDDGHPVLNECIIQLDEYFKGSGRTFDLPLRQEGTPFQEQVWNALLDIPFGKTIAYNDIAASIQNLKSVRAIGAANGKNQIAIIVPCHRVIGKDGSLTGYAGGLWRKQWLLEHEANFFNGIQRLF